MKRKPHPAQPALTSLMHRSPPPELAAPAPAVPRCKDAGPHTHWRWKVGPGRQFWTFGSSVCQMTPKWCVTCDWAFDVGCRCTERPPPVPLPPLRPCKDPDCGLYARAGSDGCLLHGPKDQEEEEYDD